MFHFSVSNRKHHSSRFGSKACAHLLVIQATHLTRQSMCPWTRKRMLYSEQSGHWLRCTKAVIMMSLLKDLTNWAVACSKLYESVVSVVVKRQQCSTGFVDSEWRNVLVTAVVSLLGMLAGMACGIFRSIYCTSTLKYL